MAKIQKPTAAEKAAHITGKYSRQVAVIGGIFLVVVGIPTWLLTRSNGSKNENVQEVKEQRVDSGSINNYNATRDIKVNNVSGNGNTIINGDKIEIEGDTIKTK